MPVGKRLRFEIFKRDLFTCQYCGRKPPDVRLEVDHIHPRADGGTDDVLNLISSCDECNRGKSDVALTEIPSKPDAVEAYLRAQQELREAQHYLETLEELERARAKTIRKLRGYWHKFVDVGTPSDNQIRMWLRHGNPVEIAEAFQITGRVERSRPDEFCNAVSLFKYTTAILKKLEK